MEDSRSGALPPAAAPREALERALYAVASLSLVALVVPLVHPLSFELVGIALRFDRLANPSGLLALSLLAARWLALGRRSLPRAERMRDPFVLFLTCFLAFTLNGRVDPSSDILPARWLPFSILREGNFDLDEFPFLFAGGVPYFLVSSNGHLVSGYPPWAGVLALPFYLLPASFGPARPALPVIAELDKLAASAIAALAVVLFHRLVRRHLGERSSLAATAVYALGTATLSSSSQGLWQHGPAQLFLTLALGPLIGGLSDGGQALRFALPLGAAVLCRPALAPAAALLALFASLREPRRIPALLLGLVPAMLLGGAYNLAVFGSPLRSGFGGGAVDFGSPFGFLSGAWERFPEGLAGVLASPGRGLLVYSPVLLLSLVGMLRPPGSTTGSTSMALAASAAVHLLLVSAWPAWWGGHCWGARLPADVLPILALLVAFSFEGWGSLPRFRALALGLSLLSVAANLLGVYGGGDWNRWADVDRHPERLWSWSKGPIAFRLRRIAGPIREDWDGREVGEPRRGAAEGGGAPRPEPPPR